MSGVPTRPSTKTLTFQRYAYKKSSPHAILKSFADDLKLLPIGPRTEKSYWSCLRQLSEFYQKSPDLITAEEIRQYCIHLKTQKKVARQTSTQAICAIKIFWEKTLKRPWPHELVRVGANPQFKLPVVLSAGEVGRILKEVMFFDHQVALTTICSSGLRLGEALKLEMRDIDSERMFLRIRAGKGNSDRYAPVPQRTLECLRELRKTHRHKRLLFPARGHCGRGASSATEPMCRSTLQQAFRPALKKSGVKKAAHVHSLRHSSATHLLEQVENLRQLQVNLGHRRPEVTALYAHLTSLCQTQHQKRLNASMNDL